MPLASSSSKITKGIYIVANDKALSWTVAFLNSVRFWEPDIEICLIPYNSEIAILKQLASVYDYTIFSDAGCLERCDNLSKAFHSEVRGYYRKFAAWSGPFDEFAYFDTDAVLTQEISWLFPLLDRFDFVFAEGPAPGNRRYVWKPTIQKTGALTAAQISFAANAGFFASKKKSLSLEQVEAKLPSALKIAEHMALGSSVQPFLNYIVVTSGLAYTSLKWLSENSRRDRVRIAHWGGARGCLFFRGRLLLFFRNKRLSLFYPSLFYLHWAGDFTKIYRGASWWRDFALGKTTTFTGVPVVTMKYRGLWEFYAYAKHPKMKRFTIADGQKS